MKFYERKLYESTEYFTSTLISTANRQTGNAINSSELILKYSDLICCTHKKLNNTKKSYKYNTNITDNKNLTF